MQFVNCQRILLTRVGEKNFPEKQSFKRQPKIERVNGSVNTIGHF